MSEGNCWGLGRSPPIGRCQHPGCKKLSIEAEDDSGAEPEIVLPVVEAIRDFCQEVLSLNWTNREVLGDTDVNSPTGSHGEMVLPSRLHNPRAGHDASEKNLNEGRNLAVAEVCPGAEEIRDRRSLIGRIRGPNSADVSENAEPVVHVVDQLATAAISIQRLRRRLAAGIGVYIEAHVVVTTIEFEFRRRVLRPERRRSADSREEQHNRKRVPQFQTVSPGVRFDCPAGINPGWFLRSSRRVNRCLLV